MPKTIAGYYQESGRAGRDGLESECLLLFAKKDFARLCNMVRTGGRGRGGRGRGLTKRQSHEMEQAREVKAFCEAHTTCRRVALLNHFGEGFDARDCRMMCDVCTGDAPDLVGGGGGAAAAAAAAPAAARNHRAEARLLYEKYNPEKLGNLDEIFARYEDDATLGLDTLMDHLHAK